MPAGSPRANHRVSRGCYIQYTPLLNDQRWGRFTKLCGSETCTHSRLDALFVVTGDLDTETARQMNRSSAPLRPVYIDATQLNSTLTWVELRRYKRAFIFDTVGSRDTREHHLKSCHYSVLCPLCCLTIMKTKYRVWSRDPRSQSRSLDHNRRVTLDSIFAILLTARCSV